MDISKATIGQTVYLTLLTEVYSATIESIDLKNNKIFIKSPTQPSGTRYHPKALFDNKVDAYKELHQKTLVLLSYNQLQEKRVVSRLVKLETEIRKCSN